MKRGNGEWPKVVVIGAGPGGLGAAMLMGSAGADVTVLEARSRVGGRTSTIEEDGYRFDVGPTFFLYPEALRSLYRMCGLSLDREVEMRRIEPHYRLVFGGESSIDVTPEPEEMARRIGEISPRDASGFARYLRDNRDKLKKITPILQRHFASARDLFSLETRMTDLLPAVRPWSSVDGDLRRYFSDPRIRLAFSFQSKYLGMSPFKCPSLFTILSFLEYEYGVFHPVGGCGTVSAAMADAAQRFGVKFKLDEPVTGLDFEGSRVTRVHSANESYACDSIIINADFTHAIKRLVPNHLRRRWSDRKIDRKRYSCSTFMLYLGVEGKVDLPHHTIFLAEDYGKNLDDIERRKVLSIDPSTYICNPSVTDETMAPNGHSSLYVLVPVPHQSENVDWPSQQASFREKVLDKLEGVGISDLRHRIRYEKMLTPHGWEQDLRIHRGATFNLAHNLTQLLHMRPQNRFEELDGVYLVGGGTHPGSGLPVIYESAKITSRLLADDLGLDTGWQPAEQEPLLPVALRNTG